MSCPIFRCQSINTLSDLDNSGKHNKREKYHYDTNPDIKCLWAPSSRKSWFLVINLISSWCPLILNVSVFLFSSSVGSDSNDINFSTKIGNTSSW